MVRSYQQQSSRLILSLLRRLGSHLPNFRKTNRVLDLYWRRAAIAQQQWLRSVHSGYATWRRDEVQAIKAWMVNDWAVASRMNEHRIQTPNFVAWLAEPSTTHLIPSALSMCGFALRIHIIDLLCCARVRFAMTGLPANAENVWNASAMCVWNWIRWSEFHVNEVQTHRYYTDIDAYRENARKQAPNVRNETDENTAWGTQIQKLLFSKLNSVLAKHPTKKGTLSSSSSSTLERWFLLSFLFIHVIPRSDILVV